MGQSIQPIISWSLASYVFYPELILSANYYLLEACWGDDVGKTTVLTRQYSMLIELL